TTVVADRAGVSRSAQLHHFPTRAELVSAAVRHVFAGLTEDYRRGFVRIAASADRVRGAVDLLWSMFQQPRHLAALDLYLAARTDAELRTALVPIAMQHRDNVLRLAREYFPEAARRNPRFAALLDLVLDTMLGMALSRSLYGETAAEASVLEEIHRLAQHSIARGRADTPSGTRRPRPARRPRTQPRKQK